MPSTDLALVCGATGGLGPAVQAAFRARGDRVLGVARSGSDLEADLGDPAAVEELWAGLDQVPRWVVNITGGFAPGSLAESTPESVRHLLRLNLESCWWSCRAAARRLQPGSAIVNVSSRAAVAGSLGAAAYGVSKAAVNRLTEILAGELKGSGVRVNAIMPSLIDTPANRATMPAAALRNAVAPEAIARTVLWLCSEEAAAVSGAVLPV
jgi:NAD(P)-dependent dehydrogenase (short-subunit alcohol dehydrogenase family)